MEETHLTVGGSKVKLLRGGQGTPLLYLHSAGGETLWFPFHDALSQHYELFAPAHPGFDSSEGLEKIDSIEDLAFHYLDFFDAMGWSKVNVMGTSLGGWLGAEIACRWPERINKLVLVDAAGLHVPGAPMQGLWEHMRDTDHMRRLIFADPQSMLAQMLMPPLEDTPDEIPLLRLKANEAAARVAWNPYFHNPKLPGRLRRITCPTLILWGEQDRLIPLEHGKAYLAGIPGATMKIIPHCGHFPIFEAVPELVAHVTSFLSP